MATHHGGYAVRPSDHDLITLVLRPMVAGEQQLDGGGSGFIHLADVYSVPPERLAERYAPGDGCWSTEAAGEARPVRGADGRRVGRSRTLAYGAKTTVPWAAVTRRGWRMVELALDGGGGGDTDLVLCKMFRSSRADAAMVAASTAATAFVSKRKAVYQHPEAPPTVRQRC